MLLAGFGFFRFCIEYTKKKLPARDGFFLSRVGKVTENQRPDDERLRRFQQFSVSSFVRMFLFLATARRELRGFDFFLSISPLFRTTLTPYDVIDNAQEYLSEELFLRTFIAS